MPLYVGPAIGARSQIGSAEEGAFGCQQQTPRNFIEMNSEGIVSEIGALVSGALRSDRAVHKRIGGVESCGGPVESEIGPSGFENWFKHALGEVQTTRLDTAFILECLATDETGCVLTITHTAGVATRLQIEMTVNSADDIDLDLTTASYDTVGEVMTAINAKASLAAYSPYKALSSVWQTTLEASEDYLATTSNSNVLEECSLIDLIKSPDQRWTVGTEWNCYSHQIQCSASLPPGLSIEVGRDVAAFLYSGVKVNTLELSVVPAEFFMGTFDFMGKGGTTADIPAAASGNTGNEKNAFKIRYVGEQATATLAIDATGYTATVEIDGTSEDIVININEPYVDPTTGVVYNVQTVGGLVAYLNSFSYLDCYIEDYADPATLSTNLKNYGATDITPSTYAWFNFNSTLVPSLPVLWGDYIGTDGGDSVKITMEIVGGGAPGTATIHFKIAGGDYGTTYTTSASTPTEIRVASNVDTGYTVFFPDSTALQAGDIWTFETIRPASTPTYSDIDPYSGWEGALTIDDVAQPIMGWSCTVNNNLYGDKYHLGERVRGKLPEQKRNVEGTVTIEFDDLDLYRRFINGTQGDLSMAFVSSDYINTTALGNSTTQYGLTIRQPRIEFNGTTPTTADEGIITVEMPYVALYNDSLEIPELRITIVSDTPYI